MAKAIDASPGSVKNWRRGLSDPSIGYISKIAAVSGYCFEWIATGEGAMRRGAATPSPAPAIDVAKLARCLHVIETALAETDRELAPAKKAELVAVVYDFVVNDTSGKTDERVLRLVRAAI